MRRFLCGPALALASAGLVPAQLNLQLAFKFVDTQAGGNGNIGVTQDERVLRYYVIDFSNTNTIHEFDLVGTFLNQWAPTCATVVPSPNDVTYDPSTIGLVHLVEAIESAGFPVAAAAKRVCLLYTSPSPRDS